jgi:uncharacterized protein YdhG (YjbR/CyaY superfamily)
MSRSEQDRPVRVDPEVVDYIAAIRPEHRPLFDRVHELIAATVPGVTVRLSYKMPTYEHGGRRLYVAAWKHGISFYGWSTDSDDGFASRHPSLLHSRSTLRLGPADAASIGDDELRGFLRAVFGV